MKRKRITAIVALLLAALVVASCSSQERFGQRKAPKNCHSCSRF